MVQHENGPVKPEKPPCLEAALAYVARGWSALCLCPPDHAGVPGAHESACKSPGKAPLTPWTAYQDRLPRAAEIKTLWNRWPNANVGIALGPVSGLIALDIDGPEAWELAAELFGEEGLPETLGFATAGDGRRLFYTIDPAQVPIITRRRWDRGESHVILLGRGCQTVMPPSIHPNGRPYTWTPGLGPDEAPIAPCPEAITLALDRSPPLPPPTTPPTLASTPAKIRDRAAAYLDQCPPAISGQNGHSQTLKVALYLVRGFQLPPEMALALIWERYNPRCRPPWSERELRHKVDEAAKIPLREGKTEGWLLKEPSPAPTSQRTSPQPSAPLITAPTIAYQPFNAIAPKAIRWLVSHRIPRGKLTVLDGDPDLGKSTLMLDIAARVTGAAGGLAPDETEIAGAPGDVLILSGEDDPADTIRPRLELAGADLSRVHFLDHTWTGQESRPIEIPVDLPLIEEILTKTEARLLVIDPLMAFLCGVDANIDQSVRKALMQLSKMAARTSAAIILQRHLNKSSNPKAIYRGGGSIAISAHARSALLVAEDPDDDTKRLLAVVKKNRAAEAPTLRFTLDPVEVTLDGQPDTICRIGWCGTSPLKANDLVRPPKTEQEKEEAANKKSKIEQAIDIFQDLLREHQGVIPSKDVDAEAKAAGISAATISAAATRLQLRSKRCGSGEYKWIPRP
jgi:RecA-family ATPase